jgi:hypothetical protein
MIRDLTVELSLTTSPEQITGSGRLSRPAGDPGLEK